MMLACEDVRWINYYAKSLPFYRIGGLVLKLDGGTNWAVAELIIIGDPDV